MKTAIEMNEETSLDVVVRRSVVEGRQKSDVGDVARLCLVRKHFLKSGVGQRLVFGEQPQSRQSQQAVDGRWLELTALKQQRFGFFSVGEISAEGGHCHSNLQMTLVINQFIITSAYFNCLSNVQMFKFKIYSYY